MKVLHLVSRAVFLVLALGVAVTLVAASSGDAASSWAGLVLVRPDRIVDESGTGSPPLPAGQDGDGYPDTDETVDLSVVLSNKSGSNLTGVSVRLWSIDSKVDCISIPVVAFGSVAAGANVVSPTPFRFRVAATADRGGTAPPVACIAGSCSNGAGKCAIAGQCARTALEAYAARFVATVTADQLPAAGENDSFDIELDLNSNTAVKTTSTFVEGFESGFTNMVPMELDANIASNTLSDGKRCQYNDPDSINSNSYGEPDCYLGFQFGSQNQSDWHVHDTSDTDGGRAFAGARSLHFGLHTPGQPGIDTYNLSKLEAIRTKAAIQLSARICRDDPAADKRSCNTAADCTVVGGGPCMAAQPELSFKQQVSLLDDRTFPFDERTLDRAVVAVRTAGSVWRKVYPYENVYDRMSQDQEINCAFDPDDDGNNEDDFFQPGDPNRRLGPSSTCAPEFAFAYLGDTDAPFAAANVGRASDGPGLQGSLGPGTWVTSKFDLSALRGRSIVVRWLVSSWKVSDWATWQDLLHWNPDPSDDGWYVDDVRVTQTLGTSAATVSLDSADRSALPTCAGACTSVQANLAADPSPSPAPGYPLNLSAGSSTADACPGGQLSYEFWIDGDANGTLGDAQDWTFAGPSFSPDPSRPAPRSTTTYGVRVRCSSRPACVDDATARVAVQCPPAATYSPYAWWTSLRIGTVVYQDFMLNDAGVVGDLVQGLLSDLRSTGTFSGVTCLLNDVPLTPTFSLPQGLPPVGDGYYYLMRGSEPTCAETPTYRTFSPKENPGDPTKRDDEITVCPAP